MSDLSCGHDPAAQFYGYCPTCKVYRGQPSTRTAEPRTAHVCPECRHWHDPDAPLVAPEAAAGSDRHGGTIRVPVEVEWRNDEAYRRGYAAGSGSPHKCPVCDGKGRYMPLQPLPVTDPYVTCHACGGSGVLWADGSGSLDVRLLEQAIAHHDDEANHAIWPHCAGDIAAEYARLTEQQGSRENG